MADRSTPPRSAPPASLPPEARRRGGMDTLFSAPWFDDENPDPAAAAAGGPAAVAPAEPAPKSGAGRVLLIVGVVLVLIGLPTLLCAGVGVAGGIYWYLGSTGAL